jgi:hypothetical protein
VLFPPREIPSGIAIRDPGSYAPAPQVTRVLSPRTNSRASITSCEMPSEIANDDRGSHALARPELQQADSQDTRSSIIGPAASGDCAYRITLRAWETSSILSRLTISPRQKVTSPHVKASVSVHVLQTSVTRNVARTSATETFRKRPLRRTLHRVVHCPLSHLVHCTLHCPPPCTLGCQLHCLLGLPTHVRSRESDHIISKMQVPVR